VCTDVKLRYFSLLVEPAMKHDATLRQPLRETLYRELVMGFDFAGCCYGTGTSRGARRGNELCACLVPTPAGSLDAASLIMSLLALLVQVS
jgi:hypothetical protein